MKLEKSKYDFIFSPQFSTVLKVFEKYNYEIRLCGGAVRDILMNETPADLDFASTATPTEMIEILEKENIRIINKGGLKHGTVTTHVDGVNFEITTLRIDIATDGRHAEVKFTTDWKLDAGRRDLTINSMFLGMDGTLYDYFNGYEDLKTRKVRFVGDAKKRISEDYLRILRYFRFYGKISTAPDLHDEYILEAIREYGYGLKRISGERIRSELIRILKGTYGPELMKTILNLGLGPHIGFPEQPNINEFDKVTKQSKGTKIQMITMLVALLNELKELDELSNRIKLCVFEKEMGVFVMMLRDVKWTADVMRNHKIKILQNQSQQNVWKSYVEQLLIYRNERIILEEFENWKPLKFPITGHMIKSRGVLNGKNIGIILRKLVEYWVDDNYNMDVEKLLNLIPKLEKEICNDSNKIKQ